MTDIEIARSSKKISIYDVANKLGISEIECYGCDKAKIDYTKYQNKILGKLILVTSINPTPYGEGKTTLAIGINDALRKLNKNSVAVLREPSMGPVFGMKGGATGGGYSQAIPMEDINLHFTGDMHAITACNNLLCALIDNHIYQGNELNIDPNSICFHRCIDINDRILRDINLYNRKEHFSITAASEIMAILCLANNFEDLRNKLDNILIGYTYDEKPVFVRNLNCTDSLLITLKDAIKPNLVQSLENNPIIIHGGPFANIAHGCNSLIATKLGLSLCDYVITEAGFGADLGAEKFFDIKCRNNLKSNLVVLNVTLKALKHNGYCPKDEISKPSIDFIKKGICNLEAHINNIKKFTSNILVVLNKYNSDTIEEINYLKEFVESLEIPFEVSEAYLKGSDGALNVANKVIQYCNKENDFKFLYDLNDTITNKIETIIKEIYHTSNIKYSEIALNKIKQIEKINYKLPICIAKTPMSFSDNPKLLGNPIDYEITIKDLEIKNGAGFIIVYLGNIIDMPGLSKRPNSLDMKIDNEYKITGLF